MAAGGAHPSETARALSRKNAMYVTESHSSPWRTVTRQRFRASASFRPAQLSFDAFQFAELCYVPREIRPAIRGQMSDEDLKAEVERLRRENETLKQGAKRGVSLKGSEKGGVSVYGLGRFPITFYQEQWLKLLDMADQIRDFIKQHEGELKKKE